ncbi:MAG: hypothetical protein JWM50_1277 [Microbacteriaceae bacterium]|jgi:hypothetical protein|nr:hypothetical protein [Microbacteriaceae bacterium]
MQTTSSSTLALAGRLRTLGDTDLGVLLRARAVRASGIDDFFDLAERLLDGSSIQAALTTLDRPSLTTLAVLGQLTSGSDGADAAAVAARAAALGSPVAEETVREQLSALTGLALVGAAPDGASPENQAAHGRFVAWAEVVERLNEWPALGLPSLEQLATPWSAPARARAATDTAATDALAAEHAFATTMAVVELVAEHQHEPARELAKGGLSLPDLKRLATAANIEPEQIPALHGLAVRAGLVALESGQWVATADAAPWMLLSTPAMWGRLADAWLADLPRDVRDLLADHTSDRWDDEFESLVSWLYPAGGEWMRERVSTRVREAELLGIIAGAAPSSAGMLLLNTGADAAAAAMARLLPREVEQVYLQHDLSIVSPGPLAPRLDARLRTMATVESHALASSYRVSLASVNRALSLGETAESISAFLGDISLTGIPQPLAYLIADASVRYGLVRVGSDNGVTSYVRSTDANLLGAILVDQALSALSLDRSDDGRLLSRYDERTVFWSLSEARYPVAAEDASGEIVPVSRQRAASPLPPAAVDPTDTIIERLREASPDAPQDNDRAWLERQLDAAVKGRLTISVTVTVQDGSSVDYLLEPTGLGGGRLRARDRKADIERTLPLSHITSVSGAV